MMAKYKEFECKLKIKAIKDQQDEKQKDAVFDFPPHVQMMTVHGVNPYLIDS